MNFPKNIQAVTRLLSYVRYGDQLQPSRDWILLLCFFFIALIVSAIWNTSFFFGMGQEVSVTDSASVISAPSVDPLITLENILEDRRVEELRFQTEYRFVDPSRQGQ